MASAHEQWMDAWREVDELDDEELRQELHDSLSSVSGELKLGAQAAPDVRAQSLALIRDVRQQARTAAER